MTVISKVKCMLIHTITPKSDSFPPASLARLKRATAGFSCSAYWRTHQRAAQPDARRCISERQGGVRPPLQQKHRQGRGSLKSRASEHRRQRRNRGIDRLAPGEIRNHRPLASFIPIEKQERIRHDEQTDGTRHAQRSVYGCGPQRQTRDSFTQLTAEHLIRTSKYGFLQDRWKRRYE